MLEPLVKLPEPDLHVEQFSQIALKIIIDGYVRPPGPQVLEDVLEDLGVAIQKDPLVG